MPTKRKLSPFNLLKLINLLRFSNLDTAIPQHQGLSARADSAFNGVIYSPKGMAIFIGVGPGVPPFPPLPFPLGCEHPSRALKGGGAYARKGMDEKGLG